MPPKELCISYVLQNYAPKNLLEMIRFRRTLADSAAEKYSKLPPPAMKKFTKI
jgi:hypothetical protein